jgi:hypothetical protein
MLAEGSISGLLKRLQIRSQVLASRSAPFTAIKTQITGRLFQMKISPAVRGGITLTVYSILQGIIILKSQITAVGGGGGGCGGEQRFK